MRSKVIKPTIDSGLVSPRWVEDGSKAWANDLTQWIIKKLNQGGSKWAPEAILIKNKILPYGHKELAYNLDVAILTSLRLVKQDSSYFSSSRRGGGGS